MQQEPRAPERVYPTGPPPRGIAGLLAILFNDAGRATGSASVLTVLCLAAWVESLVLEVPAAAKLVIAAGLLPGATLALPVVGVLLAQRLTPDFRQLGGPAQMGVWRRAGRARAWPLPHGALALPALRLHAAAICAQAGRVETLSRGARAALTAELAAALASLEPGPAAEAVITECIARVRRWEEQAAGLPPVGAKLYVRHDPLSLRAEQVRRIAARYGVVADRLNYFWNGQVLLVPPACSYRTIAVLIDALTAAGVANSGRPLPLQITVQGALGDDAKLIAIAQLLASGMDLRVEGPERRGDEGNLIARGKFTPEPVGGVVGRTRTDFLYSLVWSVVPDVPEGYADQHHGDLRVTQTLSAALLAARGAPAGPHAQRLAARWHEFAQGITALCAEWGVADAVRATYLGTPFAEVRPSIERLLAAKAVAPQLARGARRERDAALAMVELQMAVDRVRSSGGLRRVRFGSPGYPAGVRVRNVRVGLRAVRRAIRDGRRVTMVSRAGDTLTVMLDR